MLAGAKSFNGALFISTVAPQPGDVYIGGIAHTDIGVTRAVGASPTQFVNGFGIDASGALAIAPGGPIDKYAMGLPFTNDGRLVVQLNVTIGPADSMVGGIRVGPFGGVYCLDTAPPAEFGFSNGFSNGFDIT